MEYVKITIFDLGQRVYLFTCTSLCICWLYQCKEISVRVIYTHIAS